MKKNFLGKCFITLGLLLFFTLLVPCLPVFTVTAQASSSEKDKSDNYRLNLKSVFIAKGKSFTLKAYNVGDNAKVHFKSDDEEIASVNGDGVVIANKLGTTNINVIIKDGSDSTNLTCEVNVGPPAVSVKWTQSRVIIGLDNSDTLKVILKPSNTAEDARFSSKKDEIVSISPGGRITANKYGLTYLFAVIDETDSDGRQKYDTCAVIVVSQDNVSQLEDYFREHTELNRISEADLNSALYKYFNDEPDRASSSNLVSNLNRYLDKEFGLD
jgi:hypothetical protein